MVVRSKCWGPISHWTNFTVPELKQILEHCVALERLGIAQDEKMMSSIERDIALRENKVKKQSLYYKSENKEETSRQDYLIVPNV